MPDRPATGRFFFEDVMRKRLDLGRPDHVQLIFQRSATNRNPSRFRTRVITVGVVLSCNPSRHPFDICRSRHLASARLSVDEFGDALIQREIHTNATTGNRDQDERMAGWDTDSLHGGRWPRDRTVLLGLDGAVAERLLGMCHGFFDRRTHRDSLVSR
ncbi:MAG: hypothetical protein OXH99_24910 [Bryobacterales bacterium]|nr:hypothetical protein [Bryobacterales bacterium]